MHGILSLNEWLDVPVITRLGLSWPEPGTRVGRAVCDCRPNILSWHLYGLIVGMELDSNDMKLAHLRIAGDGQPGLGRLN